LSKESFKNKEILSDYHQKISTLVDSSKDLLNRKSNLSFSNLRRKYLEILDAESLDMSTFNTRVNKLTLDNLDLDNFKMKLSAMFTITEHKLWRTLSDDITMDQL